jgi:hypothetical protein
MVIRFFLILIGRFVGGDLRCRLKGIDILRDLLKIVKEQ